jgi:hypothetical protein
MPVWSTRGRTGRFATRAIPATHGPETTCQICHLNHQPIERPLARDRTPVLALVGAAQEPRGTGLAPSAIVPRVPARAPPLA